jgi:hypothetical protein
MEFEMSNTPAGEAVHFTLKDYIDARLSVDTASTILGQLIDGDKLYLMPRDESRRLLQHTARLLETASEQLAEPANDTDGVTQ